jgi:hypothetical protein
LLLMKVGRGEAGGLLLLLLLLLGHHLLLGLEQLLLSEMLQDGVIRWLTEPLPR